MPRAAKGNRTDLPAVPGPSAPGQPNGQPIRVPTGGAYGEAQQLQGAQQAVPLPQAAQAPQPGAAPQGPDIGQALSEAKNFMPPQLGELTRPTERPREPITTGLPNGPSPTVGPSPQQNQDTVSAMLTRMAAATQSTALSQLAARANQIGA